MYFVVVIGAFLEAGAAFCVVWLTMNPSSASAQLGMFAQQVSVGDAVRSYYRELLGVDYVFLERGSEGRIDT